MREGFLGGGGVEVPIGREGRLPRGAKFFVFLSNFLNETVKLSVLRRSRRFTGGMVFGDGFLRPMRRSAAAGGGRSPVQHRRPVAINDGRGSGVPSVASGGDQERRHIQTSD